MSELVRRDETAVVRPHASRELMAWAEAGAAANQLAKAVCSTSFVPKHFAGKPDEATAAILFGAEAGLSPMQALQGVYVIGGRPAMYARTMMAVVLGAGHEVWTEDLTDRQAVVCGRRRGSEHVERVVWTLDRATKAGYTSNAKYRTDPQAMLLARAQADVCRRIAPDALLGMAFTVEELEVGEEPGPAQVRRSTPVGEAAPAKRVRSQPKPSAVADDVPPLDDVVDAEVVPDLDPLMVTKAQLTKLAASLGDRGITEREQRLAFCSDVVGRQIGSSSELTRAEASRVIEELEAPPFELEPPA